jgi:hypothetical protein
MCRKATAFFTLAAFVLLSVSCVTMRTKNVASEKDIPGRKAKITSVVTVSGERIVFSPKAPAWVSGRTIVGTAVARYGIRVEIRGPFSGIRRRPDGSVSGITDGSGRSYAVVQAVSEGRATWTVLVNDMTPHPVSVPFSDVRQVSYSRFNALLTFLIFAPVVVGLVYVGLVIYERDI